MRSDKACCWRLALLLALGACTAPPARLPPDRAEPPRVQPPVASTPPPAAEERQRRLPPPLPVRNRDELQRQAARRLIAANPERTYTHAAPAVLLAVPVFRVDLNADGSIRRIEVLREPRQAKETIQMAKEALERAAPFGNVQALAQPWFFTESFLFDDSRRFKPRSLE